LQAEFAQQIKLLSKEEIADGFSISVYEHPVDSNRGIIPAWAYVSCGLSAKAQKETIFTVLQKITDNPEEFPTDPIRFLRQMQKMSEKESVVEAGDLTQFQSNSIISPQFTGLIYLPAPANSGLPYPDDALSAVPVTKEEIDVCKRFGVSRVVGRLASALRCYPYPTWCDQDRASVFSADDIEIMLTEDLASLPVATVFYASVMSEGGQCSLSLTKSGGTNLAALFDEVPEESPLVISTAIDERANALLIWTPGTAAQQSAIALEKSDTTRMAGSHLAILPGVERHECGPFNEGYVLMLGSQQWQAMKLALRNGTDFALACPQGPLSSFNIHWRD